VIQLGHGHGVMWYVSTVRSEILNLGEADETARVHHPSQRRSGYMAASCTSAAVQKDVSDWVYLKRKPALCALHASL
jgi:hypothetical protein